MHYQRKLTDILEHIFRDNLRPEEVKNYIFFPVDPCCYIFPHINQGRLYPSTTIRCFSLYCCFPEKHKVFQQKEPDCDLCNRYPFLRCTSFPLGREPLWNDPKCIDCFCFCYLHQPNASSCNRPDNFLLPGWRSIGFYNFFRAFPLGFTCSILDHRKIWLI